MSVGLLIITHNNVGHAMFESAVAMLGVRPDPVELLSIPQECDPDRMVADANARIGRLNHGDGVLVLTDLFGSTPSNIATQLCSDHRVMVVAGLNLPMLLRVLNYLNLSLEELTEKAMSGGRDGVLACKKD